MGHPSLFITFGGLQAHDFSRAQQSDGMYPGETGCNNCVIALSPHMRAFGLAQQASRFLGKVGDCKVRAGASDRQQRFHHGALLVEPALGEGSLQHRVLT
jgi:hypothetical protein